VGARPDAGVARAAPQLSGGGAGGPRQCGKTTLARSIGGVYFDLEQESDLLLLSRRIDTCRWQSHCGDDTVVSSESTCPAIIKSLSSPLKKWRSPSKVMTK